MEDLVPSTRVLLWTTHRCLSSVFERSVRELHGVKVIYEPHLTAYWQNPEDGSWPLHGVPYNPSAYDSADEKLLANYDGCSALFAKNMGYYIPKERYETYVEGRFATFKHMFLIRTPLKATPSCEKACKKSNLPFPNPEGINTHLELYELFKFVQSKGKVTAVIDADDLKANPENIMQHYCTATGLSYDQKMLSWTPGVIEDWTVSLYYKDWHWDAMFSSGFKVGVQRSASEEGHFSPVVEEQIQKEMPYYEALHKHRTI